MVIVLGWLMLWQIASRALSNPLVLAEPLDVCYSLSQSIATLPFWESIGSSLLHIALGGIAAFFIGVILALLAHKAPLIREILEPAITFLKAVPVVCVIVLMLLWAGSAWTSTIVVMMVVFPSIYYALQQALQNIDEQLSEMLKVFKVAGLRKLLFFTWPSVLPYLIAASKVAVGMSWKSGIAAELIGIPVGSIGEELYLTKITLAISDLFAWTIVIVLISLVCEKLVLFLLAQSGKWSKQIAVRLRDPASSLRSSVESVKVRACGLSIAYKQNDRECMVLGQFSYEFTHGNRYCIMAPSGYGKTSLLRVLLKLKEPQRGAVYGFDYASAVFQEARLVETCTALENCQIVAATHTSQNDIEAILEEFIPPEKTTVPVYKLSGGMRRRVELARALVAPTDVIILDEPFSGLDDETRHCATSTIRKYQGNKIIIITTHNEDDICALDATPIHLDKLANNH